MANNWYEALGDAVSDIRQKVVEEPMWGRSFGENDAPAWPEAQEPQAQMEPHGVSGDILPPEVASHESGAWPAIEHGTVLEGQPMQERDDTPRLNWPQARDGQEPDSSERNRDIDLDR